jgi:hypothetical protein
MKFGTAGLCFALCSLSGTAILNADTLVLKDGRVIVGRLVTAGAGVIDFEPGSRASSGLREPLRIDRNRVRHIEFDDAQDRDQTSGNPELVLTSAVQGRGAAPEPPQQATPAQSRTFASDVAMVLNFIKADKAGEFEMVLGKLKEALMKSPKPERQKQAAGWRIFKATDGIPAGTALYVYFVDPTVKDADYTVATILAEGLPPAELQAVFKMYAETFAQGQNFVSLAPVLDLGK